MGKGPKAPSTTLNSLSSNATGLANAGTGFINASMPAYKSATDFWSGVLSGGNTGGQQLVAPSAQSIGQLYSGNQKTLQNFMPAGGERNLALQQNQLQKASSIAGLYRNVQPYAAQQLASLAGVGLQGGTGAAGVGQQGFGDLASYMANQNAAKGASLGGIGKGLGTILAAPTASAPWWA